MRRVLVIVGVLVAALSLIASGPMASSEVADHTGGSGAGAVVVGGTPIAVAVVTPTGILATYQKRGGTSGSRWTCGYYGFDNGSTSGISIEIDYSSGPVRPVEGVGYGFLCRDESGALVHSWFGIFDPADPFSGLFAAERAAELALQRLDLALPVLSLNPPGDQLVGLPSWLSVDTAWAPGSVTASVTGVTSTVTATPVSVAWDTGDGGRIVCDGPGTRYDPARTPDSQSSDCTHVFHWPSAGQTDGTYRVSAEVSYRVEWTATTGESGDLGVVSRAGTAPVRVVEVQAVIG